MFNYSRKKIFGLDLSDLSVKIARLEKEKSGVVLGSYGRREIPAGIIDNGIIKDREALSQIIKESCKKVEGLVLGTKYCVVSLPETEAFLRVIQLPMMKKEELAEAIKWEAESHIPWSIEEVYFDWQIIEPLEKNTEHYDILVGALNKNLVDSYLAVLKKTGLQPLVFEIESIATARSLVKDGFSEQPIMIIDFGARRSSFIVFSGRTIHFTASLPIANEYFVKEISQKFSIREEEAKKIKFEQGLSQEKGVLEALRPCLNDLTAQISKYMEFYRDHGIAGHFKSKNISKILLCGGGANFSGLGDFLAKELKIKVEVGNPWVNILGKKLKKIPELPYNQSIGYATALGLALRGIEEAENKNIIDFNRC